MNDYEEMINDLANVWIKDAENGEFTPPSVLRRCKYLIEQLVKERRKAEDRQKNRVYTNRRLDEEVI